MVGSNGLPAHNLMTTLIRVSDSCSSVASCLTRSLTRLKFSWLAACQFHAIVSPRSHSSHTQRPTERSRQLTIQRMCPDLHFGQSDFVFALDVQLQALKLAVREE